MNKYIKTILASTIATLLIVVALQSPKIAEALTDVVSWKDKAFQLTGTSTFYNAGASTLVGTVLTDGDVDLNTTGKTLIYEDGTAASSCIGSATLTAATPVTVSTTCIATGDYVFVSRTSSATADEFYVDNISDGTSFDITSETGDTGTVSWIIIKGQ